MTRNNLPQNYIKEAGTNILDCQSLTPLVSTDNCDVSLDENNYVLGTKSIKLQALAAATNCSAVFSINQKMNTSRTLYFWVYIDDFMNFDSSTAIDVQISNATNFWPFVDMGYSRGSLHYGWNLIAVDLSKANNVGSLNFNNTIIRLKVIIKGASGIAPSVNIGGFIFGVESIPKCLIMFDDALASQYTLGYNYLQQKGLKGSFYIRTDKLNIDQYLTKANLDTMYANGHDICNHGKVHPLDITTYTDEQVLYELGYPMELLRGYGYERSYKHMAYPNGVYNKRVRDLVESLGIETARTVVYTKQGMPIADRLQLHLPMGITATSTLSDVITSIESCIRANSPFSILFHGIVNSGAINYEINYALFTQIIDYIAARGIDVVTISEWWNGRSNPRKSVTRT